MRTAIPHLAVAALAITIGCGRTPEAPATPEAGPATATKEKAPRRPKRVVRKPVPQLLEPPSPTLFYD